MGEESAAATRYRYNYMGGGAGQTTFAKTKKNRVSKLVYGSTRQLKACTVRRALVPDAHDRPGAPHHYRAVGTAGLDRK